MILNLDLSVYPLKEIRDRQGVYLHRYILSERVWLHHFLRANTDTGYHNHPWDVVSTVLQGWYEELRPNGNGGSIPHFYAALQSPTNNGHCHSVNTIKAGVFHRVSRIALAGCLTLFTLGETNPEVVAGFMNAEGERTGLRV